MFLECLTCCVMLFHLLICPFTKVEESFNIQAIHDIINYGKNIEKYDHLEFPGVVPRSFLGPLVVGVMSKPFTMMSDANGYSKFTQQIIVRGMLGLLTLCSFFTFCKAVEAKFGSTVRQFLLLITASQFHFIFYASRTLPNVFALVLVLLALASWLHQKHKTFIWLAGAAIIIFRFDLIMFFSFFVLHDLFHRRIKLVPFVLTTILAGAVLLGLTVAVDSFFWRRWLWPEGEVMWFNLILNKSHEYGTSPFMWYFYSALPRALSSSLLLVPVGYYLNRPVATLLWPAIGYIVLFSFLPHKELRFIIYTFPVFNTAAACALSFVWKGKGKSCLRMCMALAATSLLLINTATTAVFLHISSLNYPGGDAMRILHNKVEAGSWLYTSVHIDDFLAQTGVTRFTQINPDWRYSKLENLPSREKIRLGFSHLLLEVTGPGDSSLRPFLQSHRIIGHVKAFERWKIDVTVFPPFQVVLKVKCVVLEQR